MSNTIWNYSPEYILKNEQIFDRNFWSTGGIKITNKMLHYIEKTNLKLDQQSNILDIGCGLGGSSFLMAKKYKCFVDGIDLSSSMIKIALQRSKQEEYGDKVRLLNENILEFTPQKKYNLIFSKDTFHNIHETKILVKKIKKLVKEEAIILFSQYCIEKPTSRTIKYFNKYQYHMITIEELLNYFKCHGFKTVLAEDLSPFFLNFCIQELNSKFITAEWKQMWQAKINRIERKEQIWCIFCFTTI